MERWLEPNCPCPPPQSADQLSSPPGATPGEKFDATAIFNWLRRLELAPSQKTFDTSDYMNKSEIKTISGKAQLCARTIINGECSQWLAVASADSSNDQHLFPRDLYELLAVDCRPKSVQAIDPDSKYL